MKILHVTVTDRIAAYTHRDGVIVCGNNDYLISFAFDEEWESHSVKTARFIWNDRYYDQIFTGNDCPVPPLTNTTKVLVGLYAGDLKTTTAAEIPCRPSILCGSPEVADSGIGAVRDEAQKAIKEAQKAVKEAQEATQKAEEAAEEARQAATSVIHPTIGVKELPGKSGYELTINDADGAKTFEIKHGEEGKLTEADAKAIAEAKESAQKAVDAAQTAAEEAKTAASKVVSPTIDVTDITGGYRLTIEDANNTEIIEIKHGTEGKLTEEDAKAIAEAKESATNAQKAVTDAQTAAEEARAAARTVVSPTISTEAITGGYKLTITDANHTESIEIKNGEGGLTAQQLIDFNNMVKWYKSQSYIPMTGTFKTAEGSNKNGDYPIRTADRFFDVVFEYSFDKKANKVVFSIEETKNNITKTIYTEEIEDIPEANTKAYITATVGSTEAAKYVYIIYGEYYDVDTQKKDEVENKLTFEFCNYLYYGYAPALTEVTGDTVKTLISKLTPKLVKSRSHSFKSACPIDQYIWVAYPTRLKKASFQMGIFEGGFGNPETIDVTNQYGATESYYVYRSVEIGFSDDNVYVK